MKTHKQGFIALFFTLGVSSMLMAYVAISSTSIFDFIHQRERFKDVRNPIEETLKCADRYVDSVVRTYSLPSQFNIYTISNPNLTRENMETLILTFKTNSQNFKVTITRGLISKLEIF